jgi:ketosteroid isomerase-like protein
MTQASRDDSLTREQNISLADRIRTLEMIEEIKKLRARYCWHATRGDARALSDLFMPDGVFEVPEGDQRRELVGREVIYQMLAATLWRGMVSPVVGNHIIVIDGDQASGTCAMRNTIRGKDGNSNQVVGIYDDRLSYRRSQWFFSKRRYFTYDPQLEPPDISIE